MPSFETSVNVLPPHPLFDNVPSSDIERLITASRPLTLRPGYHVFREQEASDSVYLLLSGSVKLYRSRTDGSTVVLMICGTGEVLGDTDVMHSATYGCSAVAMEVVMLRSIPRAACLHCLQTMPTLTFNLARHALGRIREQNELLGSLTSNDIPGRLAQQLLLFADRYGTPSVNDSVFIPLRLTQSDLAQMVGASRSRVNETMTLWQRSNYLAFDCHHYITLYSLQNLRRRCRG